MINKLISNSGDRQVAANSFNQQWATPQDVNVRFNYPATGIGAITTFVQFIVEQVFIMRKFNF